MINLLPETYKKEIRAARMNVILLRYNLLFIGAVGFILASSAVVYFVLRNSEDTAKKTNSDNTSKAIQYADVQRQADEYRKNLETAKKILDNEVVYTDNVFTITKLLPSGVVLDSLNLNSKEFGTPTIISAHVKDYNAVSDLKASFEHATSVFSNVHFQSINVDGGGTAGSNYPIAVSISVTMNKAGTQ